MPIREEPLPTSPTPTNQWVAGESPDYKRHYVVYTHAPRFIGFVQLGWRQG